MNYNISRIVYQLNYATVFSVFSSKRIKVNAGAQRY